MRTDKIRYFLDLAVRCAKQGNCLRRNYGAILVDKSGTIVSTGYTGAPRGKNHCGTCFRLENNIAPGQGYESCTSVHAETNAVIQAGKSARDATLYLACVDADGNEISTTDPCYMCTKVLLNAQINQMVFINMKGSYRLENIHDIYKRRLEESREADYRRPYNKPTQKPSTTPMFTDFPLSPETNDAITAAKTGTVSMTMDGKL
jgi:dCMP deaminase